MATSRPGRSVLVIQLSSVPLQSLLYFTAIYYIFYFLCTLSMIIYKSLILSYPDENISCDVGLLFLMAGLELLRLYFGMKGNLMETEGYVVASLALTGTSVLLSVYFLAWQSYVLRADIIINAVLLVAYCLGGVLAFITLTRFTRSEFSSQ